MKTEIDTLQLDLINRLLFWCAIASPFFLFIVFARRLSPTEVNSSWDILAVNFFVINIVYIFRNQAAEKFKWLLMLVTLFMASYFAVANQGLYSHAPLLFACTTMLLSIFARPNHVLAFLLAMVFLFSLSGYNHYLGNFPPLISLDNGPAAILRTVTTSLLMALFVSLTLGYGATLRLQTDRYKEQNKELIQGNEELELALTKIQALHIDVTKSRNMETELRSAKEVVEVDLKIAEDELKTKSAFLAMMSHEIRTPMNGVVGMVDLLSGTELDTEQRQMLRTVQDSGHSLLTIIDDILDFSKIDAGKLNIEIIPMLLADCLEGAAQALALTRHAGIKLLTYVDPDIAPFIQGDPTRVRQVLINLAGNAIKFSGPGNEVLIRADKTGSYAGHSRIRFSIVDQGIGISEAAKQKVFQAFSQADTSTTRKFGGTGLGLAICKNLTELMGGEIGVTSVIGEGSTFWFELPFADSNKELEEDKADALSGLHVLVVSPSEHYQEICRSYLLHWHADVEITTDIDECLQLFRIREKEGKPPSIIVIPDPGDNSVSTYFMSSLDAGLMPYPRFVIGQDRQHKDQDRILEGSGKVAMMDTNPMRRSALINAVAIAAGRASPEIYHDHDHEDLMKRVQAPTVEEALKQGKLVLLAEDNPTNQLVIRKQLNALGYQCEIANDGKEGFDMWKAKPYCMLLSDCHMPIWDGFQLTAAIRKDEKSTGKRAPIVAITANALQGEAQRCLAAGMDDYMAKPVSMKVLKKTLVKWMGKGSTSGHTDAESSVKAAAQVEAPTRPKGDDDEERPCPIDERMLKDMFGDDEDTFKEILLSFIGPSEAIIADLIAAHGVRSATDIKAHAHKLKSSSRSIGSNRMADLCAALEVAGGQSNWGLIDEELPNLEPEYQKVKSYIDSL